MTDPVWVSNEEIVVVSSSPSSDSDTLHRMEVGLNNLMAEIALDLGEGIPVMDVGSHVSSSNPLLQEGVKFWDPPGNFTLVYEYQLRYGLMFPLPPFVQYTLACLHVALGQVTPNMKRQILVLIILCTAGLRQRQSCFVVCLGNSSRMKL
ncbi:hypothetical protein ACLB2K_041627 [Fragaria x ananassa]